MTKKTPSADELLALLTEARKFIGTDDYPVDDIRAIKRKIDRTVNGFNPAPTPYIFNSRTDQIVDTNGEKVADVVGEDTGEFIVTACNAHEQFVSAAADWYRSRNNCTVPPTGFAELGALLKSLGVEI